MKLADAVAYISINCDEVEVYAYESTTRVVWNVVGYGIEHEDPQLGLALIGYAKEHQELVKEEKAQTELAELREYERLRAKYGHENRYP